MLLEALAEDTVRVRAAITYLAPAERDLLVLRFRDDLSVAALAVVTGTDAATVERRLHHAAWIVEDRAGGPVSGPTHAPGSAARPADLVVEDAALGITPQLAARLAAAVAGPVPPPVDGRWRWHNLLAAVRRHGEHVVIAAVALAVTVPAAASLTS